MRSEGGRFKSDSSSLGSVTLNKVFTPVYEEGNGKQPYLPHPEGERVQKLVGPALGQSRPTCQHHQHRISSTGI